MDYKFQVNLLGIISLLSKNLYSGPEVFVRELLQNGIDAIRARAVEGRAVDGQIEMELIPDSSGRSTLIFQDNGIGLTEDEIHRFLATIGESSKRDAFGTAREEFIGQFGIGLLSCFMVADEIVMITRSARAGHSPMEWRGKPDGTYSVKTVAGDMTPGTRVYLRCKAGFEKFFERDRLTSLMLKYGELLPYPIVFRDPTGRRQINSGEIPWSVPGAGPEHRENILEYGRRVFDTNFVDFVPLKSARGDVEGIAFVLPHSPGMAARVSHRVYVKRMLLSEGLEGILPDWGLFVRCIINANALRPTASREAFYDDEDLAAARVALGDCLRNYLVELARVEPQRLARLISIHDLSIKSLAVHDIGILRLFADWLSFETSMGTMTLGEYRRDHPIVRYAPTVDQFRQIARVASAQGICVINAGYVYDRDLLAKLPAAFEGTKVECVDAAALSQAFVDLTLDERDETFDFVKCADRVLQRFRCSADVKKFKPSELATLYITAADASFHRSARQAQEIADEHWAGLIGSLASGRSDDPYARLYFNLENPLVRSLISLSDRPLLRHSIEMLYVQSLLLGHHPLTSAEMGLMNDGLLGLIRAAVSDDQSEQ